MTKLAGLVFLILIYLGLSRALLKNEIGVVFVQNAIDLEPLAASQPFSAILIDSQSKGFITKTYFQKYKFVYAFESPDIVIVRTNQEFFEKSQAWMGLSILQKKISEAAETRPQIPGFLFINDSSLGRWSNSQWRFYRPYLFLRQEMGWGEFQIQKDEWDRAMKLYDEGVLYLGPSQEFGPEGSLTRNFIPSFFSKKTYVRPSLKEIFWEYMQNNFEEGDEDE